MKLFCANSQCDACFRSAKSLYWHMRKEHGCNHDEAFESVGYALDSQDVDYSPGDRKYVHAHREFMQHNKRSWKGR